MDAHDKKKTSTRGELHNLQWTAKGTTQKNSKEQNAPITAAENQPITAKHPA